MTRTQEITLDVYEAPYYVYVNAKQQDNDSRILVITLTDQGNVIKPDHTSDEAVFRARKPDGTCVLEQAVIGEDGKVTVALSDQALAVPGDVEADIAVANGDDILSTASFYIQVARAPVGQEIASENDFLLLLDARDRAEAAAAAAAGSAETAGEHETAAGQLAAAAGERAKKAGEERAAAEDSAQAAGEHEQGAKTAEEAAEDYATMAKSYAVGETGSRDNEEADNAKYYSQQAATDRAAAEAAAAKLGKYVSSVNGQTGDVTTAIRFAVSLPAEPWSPGPPARYWVDGQYTVTDDRFLADEKYVYIVKCLRVADGLFMKDIWADDVTEAGKMTFHAGTPQMVAVTADIIRMEVAQE